MKYILLIAPIFLLACKAGIDTKDKKVSENFTEKKDEYVPINLDTLKGMYIGDFGGSDIRIVINFISPNHAVGYNIHKGLQRNISGRVEENVENISIELSEPGDHKFDGVFHLTFSKKDLSCEGFWKSNDRKIGKKKFKLEKYTTDQIDLDFDKLKLADFNKYNFTSVFSRCSDSISDVFFDDDGLVRYEFYPVVDMKERKEQVKIIKGTWTFKNDKIYVSWVDNKEFHEKKSVFQLVVNPDYDFYLKFNDRKLFPDFYGY